MGVLVNIAGPLLSLLSPLSVLSGSGRGSGAGGAAVTCGGAPGLLVRGGGGRVIGGGRGRGAVSEAPVDTWAPPATGGGGS